MTRRFWIVPSLVLISALLGCDQGMDDAEMAPDDTIVVPDDNGLEPEGGADLNGDATDTYIDPTPSPDLDVTPTLPDTELDAPSADSAPPATTTPPAGDSSAPAGDEDLPPSVDEQPAEQLPEQPSGQ